MNCTDVKFTGIKNIMLFAAGRGHSDLFHFVAGGCTCHSENIVQCSYDENIASLVTGAATS